MKVYKTSPTEKLRKRLLQGTVAMQLGIFLVGLIAPCSNIFGMHIPHACIAKSDYHSQLVIDAIQFIIYTCLVIVSLVCGRKGEADADLDHARAAARIKNFPQGSTTVLNLIRHVRPLAATKAYMREFPEASRSDAATYVRTMGRIMHYE